MHIPKHHLPDDSGGPWSRSVMVRYACVQLIGLTVLVLVLHGLQAWLAFPRWISWAVVLVWAAKDMALYPFVWQAYDAGEAHREPMAGRTAVVLEELAPRGYVLVGGERWQATVDDGDVVAEGRMVCVLAREGLVLLVEDSER